MTSTHTHVFSGPTTSFNASDLGKKKVAVLKIILDTPTPGIYMLDTNFRQRNYFSFGDKGQPTDTDVFPFYHAVAGVIEHEFSAPYVLGLYEDKEVKLHLKLLDPITGIQSDANVTSCVIVFAFN